MIKSSNIFLIAVALLFFASKASAQGGIFIQSGAFLIASGSPSIIIKDGKFVNDGTFTAATSNVTMEGTASTANSTIGGSSAVTFRGLTIAKSSNNVQITRNIRVNGNLLFTSGLLELNGSNITLGPANGLLVNESETSRIYGLTGGEVRITVNLNAPTTVNPGNLGAVFTTTQNMGSTVIQRGHLQQAGNSIQRYFDITPTNNVALAATLKFNYFDAELASNGEASLELFKSTDNGATWSSQGANSRNSASNYVDQINIPDFSRWVLHDPTIGPLPTQIINFAAAAVGKKVKLEWVANSESQFDYYRVERSADQVVYSSVLTQPATGNVSTSSHYENWDNKPLPGLSFYRLLQFSKDGSQWKSESVQVFFDEEELAFIYPNPALDEVFLNYGSLSPKTITVGVVNVLGQEVWNKSWDVVPGDNLLTIPLDKMAEGKYFVTVGKAGLPFLVLRN